MKVRISLTVEVDTEGWARDYGVDGAAAIRADVAQYIDSAVRECNPNLKVIR